MPDQRFGIGVETFRKVKLSFQDILINCHRVIISEGVNTSDHFVDHDAQSPPIYRFSMPLVQEDFRGKVFWCSTEGESSIFDELRKSEIRKFDVAVGGYQNILRLQIPIDDVFAV